MELVEELQVAPEAGGVEGDGGGGDGLGAGDLAEGGAGEQAVEDGGEEVGLLLRHLAPREAEVVRLRHVEQLSFAEIASALDISTSSAKTHYNRGLDKLRDLLANQPQGEDR